MSYYRQQLEEWLKTLVVKADTVLDIGGAQGHVDSRVAHWNVKNYKVLDLPDFDLEQEDSYQRFLGEADIIFCLEVFEYLINPYEAMENISEILKEGGRAFVTFAFVYPTHNELELDSTRYTENGIKRLAESVGLKIKNTWYRIDRSGLLQQFYAADGMHPAKQYQHHNATGFIVEFVK